MKFLSDILAKAGLTVDGVVTLNNTATGQTPNANDNSTKLATTAWVRTFVQPYSLPIATSSVLGGIKVGTGLSIDAGTGVLSVSGGGAASIKSTQTFTATAGQTVFTISGGYIVGLIDVFLNGVYLSPNQTTATNGTTITLGDAALAGDVIDVIIASPVYQGATTTTDQLSEGSTNLYFTNARARAAISESVTGLDYNSATGVLSITTGYGIPTTASQTTWDAAYNDKINSAAVTGTTTKTLTLTQQDGGTITASWTDDNTDAVTSVFGRTGAVVAVSGDYTTALVTEVTNLYYTDARARAAISVTGSGSYDSATGVITVTGGVTSVNTLTGAVTLTTTNIGEGTNLYYTTARANSDFDTRLATKSTTNLAEGTNLYYTTARANSDFDTRLATKSTTNLAEGTNLYYTDTRVGTYLTGNSYATQSYVSTQINNLVSGAPGLLDTLDELAAALGDDPNFATTVSTALGNRLRIDIGTQGLTGTQQGYGRTNLGLGSLSTLSSIGDAYITDLAYSKLTGVPSTFAPSAHTHDDRYYTETEIGNFFSGASAITGYNKTNWDTAYGWGNHASGGYLTTASAASTYVSLSGSYANPSWITSLAYSKITGVPAFITSYTEVDTLATVTGRGATTTAAITVTASEGREVSVYMASSYTTDDLVSGHEYGWYNDHWRLGMTRSGGAAGADFVIQWNAARRLSLTNGGNLTVTGTISASNFSGSSSGTNTGDQNLSGLATRQDGNRYTTNYNSILSSGFFNGELTPTNAPNGYGQLIVAKGIDTGLQIAGGYNSNNLYFRGWGYGPEADGFYPWRTVWHSGNLTNLNQLTNGPGYITSYTETDTLATVTARGASTTAGINVNGRLTAAGGGTYAVTGSSTQRYIMQALNTANSVNAAYGWWWYHNTNGDMGFHADAVGDILNITRGGGATINGNTIWTVGNLTNLNQLSNGPGYITAYTETDTFGTVVGRGTTASSGGSYGLSLTHTYNQTSLFHNALFLKANNSGAELGASIGFAVVTAGGDHHRAVIRATGTAGNTGGQFAIYTRRGSDAVNVRGYYQDDVGNVRFDNYVGIGQDPNTGYRLIVDGSMYLNSNGNGWAEGTFKQRRAGNTFYDVIDAGNIGSQSVNYANSSDYSNLVAIPDWRDTSYTPAQYAGNRVNWHFNNVGSTGANGDYWGAMMTVSPWSEFNTSHRQNQLWWGGSGGLSFRYAVGSGYTATGWSTWERIMTSSNASYAWNMNQNVRTSDNVAFNALSLPDAGRIIVNGETDTWGVRFRNTVSTTNLGAALKNIIWTGGGVNEGFAVTGQGMTAAFEVRNDGVVWAKSTIYSAGNTVITSGNYSSYRGSQLISPNAGTVVAADSAMPDAGHSFIHTLALGPGGNDGHILGMSWSGTTTVYGAQIWVDTDPTNTMAFRSRSAGGVWTGWNTIIHSSNIGSQSVNYANTAGSASANGGTADYAHQLKWYGAGATPQSANTFQKGILSNYYGGGAISNVPDSTYGSLYNFGGYDASSLSLQLYSTINHASTSSTRTLYFRMGNNLGFQNDWKALLDNTNYSSYALPLSGGTVTGNILFNISGNAGTSPYLWFTTDQAAHYIKANGYWVDFVGNGNEMFRWYNTTTTSYAMQISGANNLTVAGDVTAYSSDRRLKNNIKNIESGLQKVLSLNGVTFDWDKKAIDLGFVPTHRYNDSGVIAQEVEAVLPQAVRPAPFDNDGEGGSKSGENYLTVQYDKLAPLFIEAIKEQQLQIESQKSEIDELKGLVQQLINR